ncbi:hypothetical protein [Nocardia sp. XZ_19_385]|uniref:hypothetical protein n=1 Tax=Nocardia sp. XZ_19_385 TaxID=2769488 RepID=UPI00188EC565|nr:hypothetical protein [Nocardia sp. XZ_19_385]
MAPNAALAPLNILVGEWEVDSPQFPGPKGHARIEWLEEGGYLMLRDSVPDPGPSGTWIIGVDDDDLVLTVLHHDVRGVSRVYQMTFDAAGSWRVWREAPGFHQRYHAVVQPDGKLIQGTWEKSEDGVEWEHDFDLIYTRLT